jgi:hypothetical protein
MRDSTLAVLACLGGTLTLDGLVFSPLPPCPPNSVHSMRAPKRALHACHESYRDTATSARMLIIMYACNIQ